MLVDREEQYVTARIRTTITAAIMALCLAAVGCAGQDSDSFAGSSDSTGSENVVQQNSEESSDSSVLPNTQREELGTSEQVTAIAQAWAPVGVLYEGEAKLFSEYPTLADLYSNTYITFYDNGRFAYQEKIYIYRGSWKYYDESNGMPCYVLKTDSVARVTLQSGLGGEEVDATTGKIYLAYLTGDQPLLVVHRQGDDFNETPLPVFVVSDTYQVPMEASSAGNETSNDKSPGQPSVNENGDSDSTVTPRHNVTSGEQRAVQKAKSYLGTSAFSREGLVSQLEYEGFSHVEAEYGADNAGADWNEQALLKAKSYLQVSAFSRTRLAEQLEYEGFTESQAEFGVATCGADWREQAVEKARSYLDIMSLSFNGLVEQLEYEGFTYDEARYGAEHA